MIEKFQLPNLIIEFYKQLPKIFWVVTQKICCWINGGNQTIIDWMIESFWATTKKIMCSDQKTISKC